MTGAAWPAHPLGAAEQAFTVLVVVGTDHHRFDRLVDWLDDWAERQESATRVVFQHGSARAPRFGEGYGLLPHEQLQKLMADASVLVTHGGPATICEAWRHNRLPLVVPRDPTLGEHIDGHQQRFSRRLGSQGLVRLCERREDLEHALDMSRRDPAYAQFGEGKGRDALVAASVARIGQVIDTLIAERGKRRRGGRRHLPV
ncbi:MAG TPA: glycosyltransferase [Mycobacteriales bacterium]|nr:glycosyltransferase [Mycobacteriales bacterium]